MKIRLKQTAIDKIVKDIEKYINNSADGESVKKILKGERIPPDIFIFKEPFQLKFSDDDFEIIKETN